MSKTSNVKADFVQPIAVLTIICLVCAALLGFLNGLTVEPIAAKEAEVAAAARKAVLPEADDFTKLDVALPDTYEDGAANFVTEIYEATNGTGYVFMVTGNGYGGKGTMLLATALGPDGAILKTTTLSDEETPGMGKKTADAAWTDKFIGLTSATLDTVDAISGATISSNHYLNSMRSVFAAYDYITK